MYCFSKTNVGSRQDRWYFQSQRKTPAPTTTSSTSSNLKTTSSPLSLFSFITLQSSPVHIELSLWPPSLPFASLVCSIFLQGGHFNNSHNRLNWNLRGYQKISSKNATFCFFGRRLASSLLDNDNIATRVECNDKYLFFISIKSNINRSIYVLFNVLLQLLFQ